MSSKADEPFQIVLDGSRKSTARLPGSSKMVKAKWRQIFKIGQTTNILCDFEKIIRVDKNKY